MKTCVLSLIINVPFAARAVVLYAFVNVVLKVCQRKFSIGNLEYALLLQSIATNYFPVNLFQMTVVQLAL